MKVLLTGAFGHIGSYTTEELLQQGHEVRCFDIRTKPTEAVAARFGDRVEVLWGDVRDADAVRHAVSGCDAIIHLAAIIPPQSDEMPELARQVNVEGTRHLLEAAQAQSTPPKFLLASTFDLFGHTRHLPPPRRVTDPVVATDPYTEHKIACEAMVKDSTLTWTILRFADVPHIALREAHPIMYEIRLDTRMEVIHPRDVALALANALHCDAVWGKIWLIGGGARCQVTYRTYLGQILTAMGIGPLPDEAFTTQEYVTDWLDTEESQRLLQYQRTTWDDIVSEIAAVLGWRKYLMPLARPFVRRSILKLSPYWREYQRHPA
ncbi:MAG TPA: NAD(P)-dependent oxidoreductase [Anaerolineae bacterium]|nr:NAD(P)-dependent oxidoreductase [Anaerolineae bacterium]HQH38702.1 NAD(P)-dependent oxidoreductase [Anaerolineae bacterium]